LNKQGTVIGIDIFPYNRTWNANNNM
jgi:hypothetical protein